MVNKYVTEEFLLFQYFHSVQHKMLQIEADILKTLASLTVKEEFTTILKPQKQSGTREEN